MLIIFDCDGVLVDSEPIAARVLAAYLIELGLPAGEGDDPHARFLGRSLKDMRRILETETGKPLPAEFEDELRRRDRGAFELELVAIEGVAAAVAALEAPVCVASSGPPTKIEHSLRITGLLGYFQPHLFSAHDPAVSRGKPAPDLFLHAAHVMGHEPADCFVIEDSIAGVTAGRSAGMMVLGFFGGSHCRDGHAEALSNAGADHVFGQMDALGQLIDGISRPPKK